MDDHAHLFGQPQLVRRGVLHQVDVVVGSAAILRGDGHFRIRGQNADVFAGYADVDFTNVSLALQLRSADGASHRLGQLIGFVPTTVHIAVIGNGARTDDVAPAEASALSQQRHDLGGTEIHGRGYILHRLIIACLTQFGSRLWVSILWVLYMFPARLKRVFPRNKRFSTNFSAIYGRQSRLFWGQPATYTALVPLETSKIPVFVPCG